MAIAEESVIVVTGAARGIGHATAALLLERGCRVVLNDLDARGLEQASEAMASINPSQTRPITVVGDVGDHHDVAQLFDEAHTAYGQVDHLVNNAALTTQRRPLAGWDESEFDRVVRTNVKGTFLCAKAAAAHIPAGGSIVNLSSVGASRAFRGGLPYVTSKGAVEAQTRALALDLAPHGIRVNAVAPGMVVTEQWEDVSDAERARRAGLCPLGRCGTPSDIARVVAFLLSEDAAYMTGQVLVVDGGLSTQAYSSGDEEPLMPPAMRTISL